MAKVRGNLGRLAGGSVALLLVMGLVTACYAPGTVLAGSVVTDGGAAGQVPVEVFTSVHGSTPVASSTTNVGGGFSFTSSALPDGDYVVRIAGGWWSGDGVSDDPDDAVPVTVGADGGVVSLEVHLASVAHLTGRVVDRSGAAVEGQIVVAEGATGDVVAFGATGEDGRFSLALASLGPVRVVLGDGTAGLAVSVGGGTPTEYSVTEGQTLDVGTLTLTTPVAVSVGGDHACVLQATRTVSCWGKNASGQLGDGSTTDSSVPVLVPGIDDAVQVAAGVASTCVLHEAGTVSCWGDNSSGQLGDGSTTASPVPVPVFGVTDATAITVAHDGSTACAVRTGGTVWCWGSNTMGQLADGTLNASPVPKQVPGVSGATSLVSAVYNVCARPSSGDATCWGAVVSWIYFPYVGIAPGGVPGVVPGTSTVTSLSLGLTHRCQTNADGTVECAGFNFYGEIGPGPNQLPTGTTQLVFPGVSDAAQVGAGDQYTCVLRASGTVACTGLNSSGQLGNGTTTSATQLGPVTGIADAVALSSGSKSSCVILRSRAVTCWGGAMSNAAKTPQDITGLPVRVAPAS